MENFDQEMIDAAMAIIVDAGEARVAVGECFKLIGSADFIGAEEKLKDARKLMAKAHGRQTDIIQSEGEGQLRQHPLLFIHAQDTLMTINSELNICRNMIGVFKVYDARLKAIEQNNH